MKRSILSIMLAVILGVSLCACSYLEHPLSVEFQTEDDLFNALVNYCGSDMSRDKQSEFRYYLKNNTSIHPYFQKSNEAVALARKLEDSIGSNSTYIAFEMCNTSEWYLGIADESGYPLFRIKWMYDEPTCATVADAIRNRFKDPLSVSVLNGEWALVESTSMDGCYEVPLEYVGIVEVRATNSFGGYITEEYIIEGRIGSEAKLIDKYYGLGNIYEQHNALLQHGIFPFNMS